jgi:hypothetical protein
LTGGLAWPATLKNISLVQTGGEWKFETGEALKQDVDESSGQ